MPNVRCSPDHAGDVTHVCPVCGVSHRISRQLHSLSYGRQRTCSLHCKLLHRRRVLDGSTMAPSGGVALPPRQEIRSHEGS